MAAMIAPLSLLAAFVAGWAATLAVHQPTVGLFHYLGLIQAPPFGTRGTAPFGIAEIWSLAFWGGVWGIALVLAMARQRLMPLLLFGLVFGAIVPTLVFWFIVSPLRGQPIAQGWNPSRMWIGPVLNGLWGLGCALFWRGLAR
jgi:hypothetical protein